LLDIGKLSLGVAWDGDAVRSTEIRSTRRLAARLFVGKNQAQVVQLASLLFGVCGQAQTAAAKGALQAARGDVSPLDAATHKAVTCEAMQEHLWRLMLDWPKCLSLPQEEQTFVMRHALLRKIANGESEMSDFCQILEREELGLTIESWCQIERYAVLQEWWSKTDSSLARVLKTLAVQLDVKQDSIPAGLVPAWTAKEAIDVCAGRWNNEFALRPDYRGVAMETGAWSYYADSPLLSDVWAQTRSKPLMRLLARVMDLVAMAREIGQPRWDSASAEAGVGVAVVRTARGLLMHHVRLTEARVAEYVIVAPTEWNFHAEGAFTQGLQGLLEQDKTRLLQLAHIEVLSLDPCVAYEVEIQDA